MLFKMSAHEYLELDDDDFSVNGHVPGSFADGEVKVDKIEAANLEKPIDSIEVKPHSSFALNAKADSTTSNGVYSVASVATDAVPKPGHTDKADKNNSDAGVPFKVPETLVSSSSAAPTSIFSTNSQVSNNLANQSSLSSTAPTVNTNSGNNVATTSAVTTSSSNLFSAVSTPSFPGEPIPILSVSTATTVRQVPENSSLELLGDKTKQDGGFANQSHTFLPGSAATGAGTGSSSGGVSTAASFPAATNQSGLTFSSCSGSGLGLLASPGLSSKFEPSAASTAVTSGSGTGSDNHVSSAVVVVVFNFAGNTAFSSGSCSSFAATSNSGTSAFGMSATASAPTSNSAATVFGMSSASAPTSNSAATIFGMSSASAPTSNSLPTLFGASTVSAPTTSSASAFGMSNGASSTGVFPFTSFATTAASQPVFGSSNSVGFPTAPNGNNDQMSMEDSMAEDTVHASQPTVTAFGQQPVSAPQQPTTPPFQFAQQPVPTPQSPFVFGGGGTNGFSFQSQPNQSNSQNPSPFQASKSLANLQNPSPFQGSNSLTTSSFSLGAPDKSNKRMIKVRARTRRSDWFTEQLI